MAEQQKTEPEKEKTEEIWIAKNWYSTKKSIDETKENINEDFEETRRCLLNSYHSYIQTHAGYLIALIIGFLAISAAFESFIKSIGGTIVFIILIILIIITLPYMVLRMIYWTIYANTAITIPINEAIRLFDDYNLLNNDFPYKEKAPNTVIIQWAITQGIFEAREENRLSRFKRWAVMAFSKNGRTAKSCQRCKNLSLPS